MVTRSEILKLVYASRWFMYVYSVAILYIDDGVSMYLYMNILKLYPGMYTTFRYTIYFALLAYIRDILLYNILIRSYILLCILCLATGCFAQRISVWLLIYIYI